MSDGARRQRADDSGVRDPRGRGRTPYYPPRREPLRAPWDPQQTREEQGRRRSVPGSRDHLRRQGPIGRFVNTWGWRAYAIPVLLVLTALVVYDTVRDTSLGGVSAEQAEAGRDAVEPPRISMDEVPDIIALPPGGPFVEEGTGEFRVVPGTSERVGAPDAELFTYHVDIEQPIDTSAFGGDDALAQMIDATLSNPKSWTADGSVAFQRVDASQEPDIKVSLTTPMTVREHCGYTIEVEASCYNQTTQRAYLNLSRWIRGSHAFEGDLGSYRQYVVNHEVGHAIGYPEHEECPETGSLAPVMMQQTLSVRNSDLYAITYPNPEVPDNDNVCQANGWPYPQGAHLPHTLPSSGDREGEGNGTPINGTTNAEGPGPVGETE